MNDSIPIEVLAAVVAMYRKSDELRARYGNDAMDSAIERVILMPPVPM
jgi:hypothetical protein